MQNKYNTSVLFLSIMYICRQEKNMKRKEERMLNDKTSNEQGLPVSD